MSDPNSMDYVCEAIAKAFWSDYMETWDGLAENWSQETILTDFLLWIYQRSSSGTTPDIRFRKELNLQAISNGVICTVKKMGDV
jgi:hypothetical protein